jgi:hypothetical protein
MENSPLSAPSETRAVQRRRVRLSPRPSTPLAMPSHDHAHDFGSNLKAPFRRRRPLCFQALLIFAAAAVSAFATHYWLAPYAPGCAPNAGAGGAQLYSTAVVETIDDVVRGDPTPRFRGMLSVFCDMHHHPHRSSLCQTTCSRTASTSPPGSTPAGVRPWLFLRLAALLTPSAANDVMTIANLVHLGMLTGRTTIVPPFAPSHVGRDAPLVPFSEIFDLPRLQAALRVPLVEWHEVKDIESEETDTLGCWSVWNTVRQQGPRDSLLYEVQRMGTARLAPPSSAGSSCGCRRLVHGRPGVDDARERLACHVRAAVQARLPGVAGAELGRRRAQAVAGDTDGSGAGRSGALL